MPEPSAEVKEIRSSLVKVKIGNRVYNAFQVTSCHTCMHPARNEIERLILGGHSYREIALQYSETEWSSAGTSRVFPAVAWVSIFHHFKSGHLPIEAAALRQIADERAQEIGQEYDEHTARLVDGYTFARQVLHRTQESMVSGDLKPTIQDGLAAARLLKDLEVQNGGPIENEVWSEALTVYFETAQSLMPPQMWTRFSEALAINPILHAISRRLEAIDEPIDAEVVEERS